MLDDRDVSASDANEESALKGNDDDGKTDNVSRRESVFTEKEMIYINNIKESCADYDGMDIFQLMAIQTDKSIKSRFMQAFPAIKCFLCAGMKLTIYLKSIFPIMTYIFVHNE